MRALLEVLTVEIDVDIPPAVADVRTGCTKLCVAGSGQPALP